MRRIIETTVYTIEELSEAARQRTRALAPPPAAAGIRAPDL